MCTSQDINLALDWTENDLPTFLSVFSAETRVYNIESSCPGLSWGWHRWGAALLTWPGTRTPSGLWTGLVVLSATSEALPSLDTTIWQTQHTLWHPTSFMSTAPPCWGLSPFNTMERLQHFFSGFDGIQFCLHPNDQPWKKMSDTYLLGISVCC